MLAKLPGILVCAGLLLATALPAPAARTYVRGYYRKDGTYVRGYYRGGPGVGLPGRPGGAASPNTTNPTRNNPGKGDTTSPTPAGSGSAAEIKGYFRRDGTYVRPQVRTRVDGAAYKTISFRQLEIDRDGWIGPGSEVRFQILPKLDFSRVNFAGVDLKGSAYEGGKLQQANLTGAILTEMKLRRADLREALLDDADVIRTELNEADLSGAQAQAARFDGARLEKADLRGADLSDASLVGADLTGANLENAKLIHGRFALANLADARLRGADLRGADLSSAKVSLADLTGAIFSETTEWPDGFNPVDAGAILKEDEPALAKEGGAGTQALLAQIAAALSAGDVAGAAKLTEQLSALIKQTQSGKQ